MRRSKSVATWTFTLCAGLALGACESRREQAMERRAERLEERAEERAVGTQQAERMEERADRLEDRADEIPNQFGTPAAVGGGPEAAGSGVVRDPGILLNDSRARERVGQPVSLQNVTVRSVVNDHSFWIGGAAPGEQLLVVLDSGDGAARLQPGQTVVLRGHVGAIPQGNAAAKARGLGGVRDARLDSQQVYLRADRLEVR